VDKDDKAEDLAHEKQFVTYKKMHGALRFFRLCLAYFGLDCVGRISLHCCAYLGWSPSLLCFNDVVPLWLFMVSHCY